MIENAVRRAVERALHSRGGGAPQGEGHGSAGCESIKSENHKDIQVKCQKRWCAVTCSEKREVG